MLAFLGRPRVIKDVDVFVEASVDNTTRLLQALDDFGFGSVGVNAGRTVISAHTAWERSLQASGATEQSAPS